jgi:hypothetical protein
MEQHSLAVFLESENVSEPESRKMLQIYPIKHHKAYFLLLLLKKKSIISLNTYVYMLHRNYVPSKMGFRGNNSTIASALTLHRDINIHVSTLVG